MSSTPVASMIFLPTRRLPSLFVAWKKTIIRLLNLFHCAIGELDGLVPGRDVLFDSSSRIVGISMIPRENAVNVVNGNHCGSDRSRRQLLYDAGALI